MTNCSATPRDAAPDRTNTGWLLVREPIDDGPRRRRVDLLERRRDVRLLDLGVGSHVVEPDALALQADPFGGRTQLAAQLPLDGLLQPDVSVVAELVREPDDGRRAGSGCLREVGDGSEPDDLRAVSSSAAAIRRSAGVRRSPCSRIRSATLIERRTLPNGPERLILFHSRDTLE